MRLTLAATLFSLTLPLAAQTHTPAPPPTHPTSTPYTGDLSVFDEPGRDQKLQIDRVMSTLHLHPGSRIADIGAGGGWFSVRAAIRVAPYGTVYAEDINPAAVDYVRARALREHLSDIAPVLGTPDDPKLPLNTLDAAFMLRVYHEIAHPPVLLANLHNELKPGGLLAIIDHPGNGADHGINADVVIAEVQRNGFHLIHQYDFTKGDQNDYFLLFAASDPADILEGVVTDAHGAPAPGAYVRLTTTCSWTDGHYTHTEPIPATARTDSSGHYVIHGHMTGGTCLRVEVLDVQDHVVASSRTFDVAAYAHFQLPPLQIKNPATH
jgi:SAM-dependent methyltransferase